jgi:hypothetical protein
MYREYKNGCLVCGSDLLYHEHAAERTCQVCMQTFNTNAQCSQGHFICDNCHRRDAMDYIETFCINSRETDPLALAVALMKSDNFKLHGPEHHFLVPAVLLAAYYNTLRYTDSKVKTIAEARKRATNVPGGACGLHGSCGAGVGAGIFISLITDATPLSKRNGSLPT